MLKAILVTLAALGLFVALAGAIIVGAQSLPVPVSYAEQQDCLARAKAGHNNHPNCPERETVWDRGLSDPVAFYTLWLTLFTLALAIGAAFQSGLIARQIKLARDEFNTTHRPRIKVRTISYPEFASRKPVTFEVTITNGGDNVAEVTAITVQAIQQYDDVGVEIELLPIETPSKITLVSGAAHTVKCTATTSIADVSWESIQAGGTVLVVSGDITYNDKVGITRHTSFARELNRKLGTYSISRDYAENEYED